MHATVLAAASASFFPSWPEAVYLHVEQLFLFVRPSRMLAKDRNERLPAISKFEGTEPVDLKSSLGGGHWRLFRTLHIYCEARTTTDILDRLHQYCRCIDGLILPKVGETKRQFKSRTELFIGPRHHDVMGEIYDVRSAVEHLHENRYLEGFDRTVRLDLLKKEAIAEHIARTALARVIGETALWPHFANTPALAAFWALPERDRRQIWGGPIDPMDALKDFDPRYIHDGHLGAA